MTEAEKLKKWVRNWESLGPRLEKLRVEEYRNSNIADTIFALRDASEAALRAHPPKPTSGLVEMQRLFAKLRRR